MNELRRCGTFIKWNILSHEKDKIMPFAATQMELETLHTEWRKSEKDTMWYHLYVESKIWYKWSIYKADHGHGGPTCVCQGRGDKQDWWGLWGWWMQTVAFGTDGWWVLPYSMGIWPAATGPIRLLAWGPPYALGVALKRQKRSEVYLWKAIRCHMWPLAV